MTNHIEAPGRSALWTEAALRALTGAAFLSYEGAEVEDDPLPLHKGAIKAIALDAMAIATAFEAACIAAHEADQEAVRERVRAIGRFSYGVSTRIFRVESVARASASLVSEDGDNARRTALVCDLIAEDGDWMPTPTTGGEERV